MIYIEERIPVKCPGLSSLFVKFDFNKLLVEELKLLENVFFNSETKEWEIPITGLSTFLDRCCLIDSIQLKLLPTVVEERIPTLYNKTDFQTSPFDYQMDGIHYGVTHDSWLLLDAPGLGKTLQIIYIAQKLKEERGIEHCLIICGLNTLKFNWKKEIEKHSNLSCRILGQRINRKGKLVVDGIAQRLKQLQNPIEEFFVIVNVETLRDENIIKAFCKNKFNKFDMMTFDEIHVAKSPTSTQGKNLLKLKSAKYKIGATGTLLLNNPMDCYLPLKWIGVENSTYSNFKYYYSRFGGPFGQDLLGFKNLSVLKNQIESCSLRRTKDILNLPPKTVINEYVEMLPAQADFYNNIVEGIVSQVDKVHISTANLLAMVTRLRQATACPSILTTERIPSAKIERTIDLVDQLVSNNEKVVIFSTFKETVYELQRRLSDYKLVIGTGDLPDEEVSRNKDLFQEDPEIQLFIGTTAKCGTGITLNAASYMIFIDIPWTSGVCTQCEDRIHRIGSKNPVFIYRLITTDTIDERVLEIVNDKSILSDYVIDDAAPPAVIDRLRQLIGELHSDSSH